MKRYMLWAMFALAAITVVLAPGVATAKVWTAESVSDLIAAINAANAAGESNTIILAPGTTFTLTAVDNTTNGATGLPVIAAKNNLTIVGNGATIVRNTEAYYPWQIHFRLFDVAAGASLTLENVRLENGVARGPSVQGQGGAILNRGTLTLSDVRVYGNGASGGTSDNLGQDGAGGGIYSSGALILGGGTEVSYNYVSGGTGGLVLKGKKWYELPGGNGLGGGVYVAGGTATLDGVTLYNNNAQSNRLGSSACGGGLYVAGGTVTLTSVALSSNGAYGNAACGGGLYAAGGSVTLTNVALSSNIAKGQVDSGAGYGGGLYVAGGTVVMSGGTLTSNTAQGATPPDRYPESWVLQKFGEKGGNGYGGGLCVAGGSVTLTGVAVSSNTAVGGSGSDGTQRGGEGGNGYGGALYAFGGTTTLRNDTVSGNSAQGGDGGYAYGGTNGRNGLGEYGGLYIVSPAIVYLDAFTFDHTTGNEPDDIYGPYTPIL